VTTVRDLLRYCLRRFMWKPLTCPECAQRLDWGASWHAAPSLVLQRHALGHHVVAGLADGIATGTRNPALAALIAELADARNREAQ
jgi:hypothetical protein